MSKPKHCRRGKGRYLGYGYSSTDLNKRKGAWMYADYLTNEIEDNKHKGGELIEKLRKYLKRAKP